MAETDNVRAFFERLAEDDEFRQSVIDNPRQVMDDYDIEYKEEDIPDQVQLPSKEDLRGRMDEYVERLGEEPVSFGIWMFIVRPPEE